MSKDVLTEDQVTVDAESGEELRIPRVLPIVPLRDLVAFPSMMFPLVLSEPGLLKLADEALSGDKLIGLFTVEPDEEAAATPAPSGVDAAGEGDVDNGDGDGGAPEGDDPGGVVPQVAEDSAGLAPIGTVVLIHKMLRFPDGGMRLLVQGVARAELLKTHEDGPFLRGTIQVLPSKPNTGRRAQAMRRNALELFQRLVDATGYLSAELKVVALNIEDPGRLADFLGANLNLSITDKLELLQDLEPGSRLQSVTGFMVRELDILALGRRIQDQVQTEMEKNQREFYLRQQMKAIQRELGEGEDNAEIEDLRERIEAAEMPEAALKATLKEYERLTRMPPQAAEYTVALTYIEWMLQLPWQPIQRPQIDVNRAEKILDEDHYDLEEVKERILEYLAIRRLNEHPRSPILCLAGPPGVGKTSLGQSIARAIGRPFHRLSLGGLHDEAEIRGHRRTYIGSMPGRIIQGIAAAEANDPVFMLDEIDKVGSDFRGDPTSALLEVLDPAQNDSFQDNYLNVPFDLSRVLFITTANMLDAIPGPLRDRMEVIELPGYTTRDKVEIAKRYLVPKALEDTGITPKHLRFTQTGLATIAGSYTREAGVRNLERQINRVARKVAMRVARGKRPRVRVTKDNVTEFLGQPKVYREQRLNRDRPGVVTGLAWTPYGGEILFVEATRMKGTGRLNLTGQLGDVMRESAQAAISYVRAHALDLGIDPGEFEQNDLHIHVPAGAMPKDGPSAGVAMVTAVASLYAGIPVRADTAMTGEISLRGSVLPIGGLKQKVLGAKRAGIKRVIVPRSNEPDLEDVPEEVLKGMTFLPVDTIDEVLHHALKTGTAGGRKSSRKGTGKPGARTRPKPRARGKGAGATA